MLIVVFITTVSISDYIIKKDKKKYEKTTNDSCVCPDDSTRTFGKM